MDDKITAAMMGDRAAQDALRAQTEDNPPLTLEELRGMEGEPVWDDTTKYWVLVDAKSEKLINKNKLWRPMTDRCYRRKPEEGEQNA